MTLTIYYKSGVKRTKENCSGIEFDALGLGYRHNGIMSFVEPDKIEGIEVHIDKTNKAG